ncbi:hypothetical protein ABWK46_21255, partial [Peribacillus frigoritolerans]|uniref:hypothetical protein n=1 Tax=Peribacillus frigoritolerans TaxID=450367 RepID=UPI003394A612
MFLKQNLLTFMVYFYIDETYIGLKKFATLLPYNWLAETPQALAPRRLGRRSAERERISEIDWTFLIKSVYSIL